MYIKRTFTCQSDNLVYAITCQLYKMIYVGETARSLVVRFAEHLADIRHNRSKPVAQHFNSAGHTPWDLGCYNTSWNHSGSDSVVSYVTFSPSFPHLPESGSLK